MSSAISNAIDYAKFYSRSHDAVIRVCDEAGKVIQTHARGQFQRTVSFARINVALSDKTKFHDSAFVGRL